MSVEELRCALRRKAIVYAEAEVSLRAAVLREESDDAITTLEDARGAAFADLDDACRVLAATEALR